MKYKTTDIVPMQRPTAIYLVVGGELVAPLIMGSSSLTGLDVSALSPSRIRRELESV